MVTGGEDKRVNLFAVGKPTAILSMAGHQSAVECVTFDANEEVVVAGAAGGTLKLWDLEQAKAVRTLSVRDRLSVRLMPRRRARRLELNP